MINLFSQKMWKLIIFLLIIILITIHTSRELIISVLFFFIITLITVTVRIYLRKQQMLDEYNTDGDANAMLKLTLMEV